jgi:hypothetical protein
MRGVFGAAGCEVLYRRALARSAAEHPVLRGVARSDDPEALIQALHVAMYDHAAEVAAALRTVMAEEISLLARLVGEDLVEAILLTGPEPSPEPRAESEPQIDE